MKKLGLLLCVVIAAGSASPALALPAFKTGFAKKYNMESRVVTCDVCHVPKKDKKEFRNEYGTILATLLDAEQFKGDNKLTGDEADKVIFEALDKAAKEKCNDGKSWEDHIKSGTMPGLKQ
ncbi:MAG: hypothetical protein KY475_27455 [Planctomycetes bacterium]|nr:hypothetical protein [Planctomycetota bacterium]